MTKKIYLLIFSLLCCYSVSLYSNNAKATTKVKTHSEVQSFVDSKLEWRNFFKSSKLISIIDSALITNADIQQAMYQLEIANNYYRMSKGALYPSLNIGASYSPTSGWLKSNPIMGNGVSFISSWEIDLWGKLNSQKKAAKSRFLASEQSSRLIKTNLISEIAKAYYELVFFDEELRVTDKNINLQSNALEIVKVQKEAGKATNLAVLQFEAQLLESKTKKFEIERKIIFYENLINLLLNKAYQPIERDKDFTMDIKQQIELKNIPSEYITNRPDIVEANLQLHAAGFDVKAAQKAFFPSLMIQPNFGLISDNPATILSPLAVSWGLFNSLTLPIFQNNVLKSYLNIRKAEQKQALINYKHKLYKAFAEVSENIAKIESTQNEIIILKNEVAVLDSAVSNSNDLYIYGYASYLEVINTQKSVQETELKLISIEKEHCHLWIDLFRSLGGGY